MIEIKNKLFYILFTFIGIVTISNAQVYQISETVDHYEETVYKVKESIIYMQYNPPQPKRTWWYGTSLSNTALWVTTDNTEIDLTQQTKLNSGGMKLHIYHPEVKAGYDANNEKLPVIVFGYGGGFLSKYAPKGQGADISIQKWLAERGYIVVAPEYRIGIDLFEPELAKRAIWRAVQDMRKVISKSKFLSTSAYCVDRSKPVTYVGYSSGALIGLHNLYLNETNRPESTTEYYSLPVEGKWINGYREPRSTYDLGTLDLPVGGDRTDPDMSGQTVQDITVAISGAIGDLTWISNANSNPKPKALYLIHNPNDGVVPYNEGFAYAGFGLFQSKLFAYPTVFGSNAINDVYQNYPLQKPSSYKFRTVKLDCGDDTCIQGNAGGPLGPLGYRTWHHNPTEDATNILVMRTILLFIKESSRDILIPGNPRALSKDATADEITEVETNTATVSIYPNPVTNTILNVTLVPDNTAYKIVNVLGQNVSSGVIQNGNLLVGNLTKGVYILQLEYNNEKVVKQFIKQ